MYLFVIVALFGVLPIASIVIEASRRGEGRDLVELALKWFVFWGVGMRLFTAGVRQTIQPEYTAGEIFGIADPVVLTFVQELGFANISMGLLGLVSLLVAPWRRAAALVGTVFFGIAGIRHALEAEKATELQMIAMISDLFIALVLGVLLLLSLRRARA
jgi:hypothetical protein